MSSTTQIRSMITAIIAAVIILGSAAVVLGEKSDAAISGDYGQIYEISLAPGFSYTYTPSYPADLEVTTSILDYEENGIDAEINGSSIKVTVKSGVTSGSYDLIVKAETNTGGLQQTAYQHIRFNIVSGLVVAPGQVINDIIAGASINFTPQASSGMDTVIWTVNGTLPAGLTFSNGKVSGTPTEVGPQTVSLTATAKGETKDLTITFTVYNVIIGGNTEIIYSNGNSVSSAPIVQTGSDLGVTWAVTNGTLPSGFVLDPATGVVSGSSTTLQETTVTITGTSANGPAQSVTKDITIRSEPVVDLTSPSTTVTIYDGSSDKTLQLIASEGSSTVTWSVSPATGISIDPATGLLTVTSAAESGTVTVTATTEYGGTAQKVITIVKEDQATISGSDTLTSKAGDEMTGAYTSNVAGTWSVDSTAAPIGATVTIDENGVLKLSGASPTDSFDVIVKLTTAGGQEITKTVSCKIVSALIFNDKPTTGLIVIEA